MAHAFRVMNMVGRPRGLYGVAGCEGELKEEGIAS